MTPEEKANVRNQLNSIMDSLFKYDARYSSDDLAEAIDDAIVGIENLLIDLED